ncbi:MAG: carboxypeptidase regulatory-like domain-containing protein, partial [Coriobacteriia bacterium]|nr:carboxypeptidase regulatory-like domain-containing protein [Coriobacteriia bacterium]
SMLDFPTSHDPPPGVYLAFDVQNEVSQEETLPLGTYYYSMFASDWAGNWSSEPVTCTVTVSTLRDPCAIEGQITHMGAPVEGIGINLYEKDGSEWQWFKGEVSSLEPYFFDKLEPGTFRVGCYDFSHKLTRKYYKNATTFANAEDIVLTEGQGATGIDIALEGLGDIGGTVTSSGLGVQDITVKMYRWTGTSWLWVRDSITGPTGDYLATGLREGDYRVSFYDPSGTYVREWFDDVSSAAEASSVPVFSDTLTGGIDADIVKVTQLGGTVTDSGGAPLPDISVLIYNNATGIWRWRRTTTTDADGLWGTSGLDPGEYRVSFLDPGGTYIREYWDDWTVFNRSDIITITAGESRGDIDAELAGLGTISGTVTDEASSPIVGLAVKAYRLGPLGFRWYRDAITLGDGTYSMPNLREGTYRISFHDPSSLWAREWYDNAPSITLADDLALTAGGHLSSIDASVASSPW